MKRSSGFICTAFVAGLMAMSFPAQSWSGQTGLEGRVVFGGAGLAGVYVEVFDAASLSGRPISSANTGSDGSFRLELPRGSYRLTARRRPAAAGAGGMLYGTSGDRGLPVGTGYARVPDIRLADTGSDAPPATEGALVRGRVLREGGPAAGCSVYFYPGALRRGPGYLFKAHCREDGRFEVRLAPGTYTLAARMGREAEDIGSVDSGDLVGDYDRNPFVVSGSDLDLGVIALRAVDGRILETRRWGSGAGAASVDGRVVDGAGRPVAGVQAFLYNDHRMVGKPSAISAPTGPDGRFALAAQEPGTYYLGARSRFGGPVEPGEWMGAYGGNSPEPIHLPAGAARGMTIVVREVW